MGLNELIDLATGKCPDCRHHEHFNCKIAGDESCTCDCDKEQKLLDDLYDEEEEVNYGLHQKSHRQDRRRKDS